ncbi:MAG TPA: RsmD family RNA methyltransferase [Chloroflexota bacterium]|jgi:hypothetical protein|nr:RsmD family RNA methyltransferase [Chloroflexota bacterium]
MVAPPAPATDHHGQAKHQSQAETSAASVLAGQERPLSAARVAAVKSFLRDELAQALTFIVADPRVSWEIAGVSSHWTRSDEFGLPLLSVRLKVLTNDRAALLGQQLFLPRNGLAGFAKQYCLGYLDGALCHRFGLEVASAVAITLDVHQVRQGHSAASRRAPRAPESAAGHPEPEGTSLPVYLPLEEAIAGGLVHPDSPLGRFMRRYDLRHLLTFGGSISGPSLPMLLAVEQLTASREVQTVLDLFSGSGSLARVALERAGLVVCVDTEVRALQQTLAPYLHDPRLRVVQADARDYLPTEHFDLAMLDPFYEEALDVLPPVLRHLAPACSRLLVNLGPADETYWVSQVTRLVRRHVARAERLPSPGHAILLARF